MSLHPFYIPQFFPDSGTRRTAIVLLSVMTLGLLANYSSAASPVTPSGLNTQVNLAPTPPPGKVQYNITGGTRAGTNLFHSFGDFNVPSNNIANFLNDSGLATSNILSRVTGGSPSSVFGIIQTNGPGGFGNANLFLMNPAGIIFGPTATLNVGGMATFTTADYLRLGGAGDAAGVFYSNPSANSILTAAPVAAFGFLGSNPAAISVQGSQLGIQPSQALSLVGGDIEIQSVTLADSTVQSAKLTTTGGQINLVSVASPGEILFPNLQSAPNINGQSFTEMGSITLSQGALLDVSDNAAGTVRIRGGQLVMDNATISTDTVDLNGAPIAIDISLTGDLSITANAVPALTARTIGTGDGGEIRIAAHNINMTATGPEDFTPFSVIDTHTSGSGKAGDVTITAPGNVTLRGDPFSFVFPIDSGTTGLDGGHGGNVTIIAGTVQLASAGINTGDYIAAQTGQVSSGSGGDVTVTADRLYVADFSSIATDGQGGGTAGAITISARDVQITNNSILEQQADNGTGKLQINATNFAMNNSGQIISLTEFAPGGGITINANTVTLTNGSTIQSQTVGNAPAGDIRINATDHVSLADDSVTFETADLLTNFGALFRPSGLFTNSLGGPTGNLGSAGAITVTTPNLSISGGARIDTATQTNGAGGNAIVTANTVLLSGQRDNPPLEAGLFDLGDKLSSGIFTRTIGGEFCTGTCGTAGQMSITTGALSVMNGALLNSSTSSTGQGGNITVHATDTISLSGTLTDSMPGGIFSQTTGIVPGSGTGGNITLNAGQSVTISEGAQVSASTSGPGNAGKITIGAESLIITSSFISADTFGEGNAGGIEIQSRSVSLTNFGVISSAAIEGPGNAGNIYIAASDRIDLNESAILSNSFTGGNSGQISIISPIVELQSSSTLATAAIGHGRAGAITVQTNSLTMNSSEITSSTAGEGHGGTVAIFGLQGSGTRAQTITLSGDSQILTETANADPLIPGEGAAGNITLSSDRVSLANNSLISATTRFSQGHAGDINIDTGSQLIIDSNSEISSRSIEGVDPAFHYGNAGSIFLNASNIALANGGAITAGTETNGAGGAIELRVGSLSLTNGGHLTTGSTIGSGGLLPTGPAGNITVRGSSDSVQSVVINGPDSGIFTTSQGTGSGGNIAVSAQSVTLQNGAQISSSSTGSGPAGNIQIDAGNQLSMANSAVTTEATHSSGGSIKVTTDPSGTVQLTNSTISASVLDGTGGGGSVNIDPQFVILQNSQILAQAVQGSGGNIGITITNGGLFLPDATSVVSASSQFGQSGTVTIQAPIAPAGGKIQPLGKAPLQVTALLSQRCAAIARGEVSSFVVAGRDTLPIEPGGWLISPLALASSNVRPSVEASVPVASISSDDSAIISLRHLPSTWTIAQIGQNDWFEVCSS